MINEPCKIFVAAYTELYAIVVFTDSDIVSELVGTHSPLIADVMGGHKPPSDGLWMFEGRLHSVMPEDETNFTGEWRRPTDAEAIAAASGENPCMEPCGT